MREPCASTSQNNPSEELEHAIKNVQRFLDHNQALKWVTTADLEIQDGTLVSKRQSGLRKTAHFFKKLFTSTFSQSGKGSSEKEQSEVTDHLMRSVDLIKTHYPTIEHLRMGTHSEKNLANLALNTIHQYNTLLQEVKMPPKGWGGQLVKFLFDHIGWSVKDEIKESQIDLPLNFGSFFVKNSPSTPPSFKGRIVEEIEVSKGKVNGFIQEKDLFAVKGHKTTWGADCYRNRVIDTDATVVSRLNKAGAVLMAKLSTGRFASGANWFSGKTRNPWNTEQSSSGSSAGPGAATAAGLVGFSIGSETRGSIAGPCERCGVSGLRPTFGRVSRYGAMTLSWSMDKVGPICRSIEDCAVVFNAVYGPDGYDSAVVDIPFNWNPSLDVRQLRVGYVRAEFEGEMESVGDRARLNKKFNNDVLDVLRSLGIKLVPIELPSFKNNLADFILFTEAAAAFDYCNAGMNDLIDPSGEKLKEYPQYRFVPGVEYIQVNRYRTILMREMADVMSDIDAYVTPTFVGPTNWLTNITGHPEVIIPNVFTGEGTL